jgi:ribose 5-phosphate isomerase B
MRVYLGSDHAGFELKARVKDRLAQLGHEPVDCGPLEYHPDDDYPPYVIAAATKVAADQGSVGVVIGGSGNGEQIAANKVVHVRAALAWSPETARLARLHNDANVIALGARQHTAEEAVGFVEVFVATPFSGDERHGRRLRMIADYEVTGSVDPGGSMADGPADDPG